MRVSLRAVLRLFVRRGLFDEDQAQGMLQWPHSGFHVHAGVGVPGDDRAFALRLARYCARNPVALERMTYDAEVERVVQAAFDDVHGDLEYRNRGHEERRNSPSSRCRLTKVKPKPSLSPKLADQSAGEMTPRRLRAYPSRTGHLRVA